MLKEDIKIFGKNEKELETLIQTIWIYCKCIGIKFRVEKCNANKEKREKRNTEEFLKLH